jgi:hypothetical protein
LTPAEILARIKKEKPALAKWIQTQAERRRVKLWHRRAIAAGKCRQCNQPSDINPQTRKPFRYCAECRKKVADYSAMKREALAAKKSVELPKV